MTYVDRDLRLWHDAPTRTRPLPLEDAVDEHLRNDAPRRPPGVEPADSPAPEDLR